MAITLTYHGISRPQEGDGGEIDCLPAQIGAAITVADDSVAAAPLARTGLYRVKATSACIVRFGEESPSNASDGEVWDAGEKEVRWLLAGTSPAVDAPA